MENQIMPKQYIEFKCLHQRIERTDDFFVVGGSQKYLHAKFDLCPDWSGFQQYAVFTGGLKTFRIPIVDGECEVPWEMLLEKRFFVGCEAGQRITSNAAEVKVHPCGAPEETGTPREPTPTLQSQIGNLGDLKTEAKDNLVDAINEVYDNPGGGSTPGEPGADGEDGGYYIPNVSQVDENTMSVSFAASKEGMADVADQEITLPSGKNGADGKPGADGKDGSPGVDGKNGSDGITPHIGANGNWWIGEEDTGVSAGATDEQISGAVEEYMEDNPLVKTVNGTAPDENGDVVLDIPSGGGGGLKTTELIYELVVSEEDVYAIHVPIDIRKYEHFRLWIETNVNSKTFRIGLIDASGQNYYLTTNGNVQIYNSAVADFSILSNDLVDFKGLRTSFRNKYGAMDGGLVVGPIVVNIEASSLRLWREDNFKIGEIVRLYAVPWG